jgi:hypothetical protein
MDSSGVQLLRRIVGDIIASRTETYKMAAFAHGPRVAYQSWTLRTNRVLTSRRNTLDMDTATKTIIGLHRYAEHS